MKKKPGLTLPEKVLSAALSLENRGRSTFGTAALVMAAWESDRRAFGLEGYHDQSADSHKIVAILSGTGGLVGRGLLRRPEPKMYALTPVGRTLLCRRGATDGDEVPSRDRRVPVALAASLQAALVRMLDSTALDLYRSGRLHEASFKHACAFWGIEAGRPFVSAVTTDILSAVRGRVNGGSALLPGGRKVSGDEVRLLVDLHEVLAERFNRHLTLMRNRKPVPA